MKGKVLAGLIVVLILLDIAGIVFFVLFLGQQKQLRNTRQERRVLEQQLAVLRAGKTMTEAMNNEKVLRRTFASHHDGVLDWYAFQLPRYLEGTKDYTLVVYLHGMGSNYMEPFVNPSQQPISEAIAARHPDFAILSPNYRKDASWGNEVGIADISQNIRHVLAEYPFKRIVLMGTSMGGCTALTYAALAPEDIRKLIVGVVSMESSGDLLELYKKTRNEEVKRAMIMAFHAAPEKSPEIYRERSFLSNLDKLTPEMNFYILGARADNIVPFYMQEEIVRRLKDRKLNARLESIEGNHTTPSGSYYVDGLDFVISGH